MSTSLNNTVENLFRDLIEIEDARRKNDYISKSKLRKLFNNPIATLKWWFRKAYIYTCTKYGRYYLIHKNSLKDAFNKMSDFNEFTPTDKKFPELKIAIYTSITGGYDNLKDPIYVDDDIDYYVFTDNKTQVDSTVWKHINAESYYPHGLSDKAKNRFVKINNDEILKLTGKNYDYSIYIDGSIRITCDIKPLIYSLHESGKTLAIHNHANGCAYREALLVGVNGMTSLKNVSFQMKTYKEEGFPENFGLFENAILIRKSGDKTLNSIMHDWWNQYFK